MFEFCFPTKAASVPDRPNWLHEVKYDGYRIRLERDGDRVRLITRGGYNWTDRYPWIVESALKAQLRSRGHPKRNGKADAKHVRRHERVVRGGAIRYWASVSSAPFA
jgi:hypothetical protein